MIHAVAALALAFGGSAALAQPESSSYDANPGMLRSSGFAVFFGIQGPLSYESPSPAKLPADAKPAGEVRGRSCQHGLSIPLGLGLRATRISGGAGKGGFDRAVADILRQHPDLRGLYDAKVDDHVLGILGVYQRLCTEITAWGFK